MAGMIGSPYRVAPMAFDATTCLSVVARWGDEVLAVAHLRPGERFALAPAADDLARELHALVHPEVSERCTLAEHTTDGRCVVLGHPEPLVGDAPITHVMGPIAFTARRVPMMDGAPRELLDAGGRRVLAIAVGLLVGALVLAVASWLSPLPRGVVPAYAEDEQRLRQALSARWRDDGVRTARIEPPASRPPRAIHIHTCCFGPCHFSAQEVDDYLNYTLRLHYLDQSWGLGGAGNYGRFAPLRREASLPLDRRVDCRVVRGGRWVRERALNLKTAEILDERRTLPPSSFRVWRRPDGTLRPLTPAPIDPRTRAFFRELRAIRFGVASRGEEIRCRLR